MSWTIGLTSPEDPARLDYFSAGMLDEYIDRLRVHVEKLAKGDNLASKWCYQFCERGAAPFGIQEQYVSPLFWHGSFLIGDVKLG